MVSLNVLFILVTSNFNTFPSKNNPMCHQVVKFNINTFNNYSVTKYLESVQLYGASFKSTHGKSAQFSNKERTCPLHPCPNFLKYYLITACKLFLFLFLRNRISIVSIIIETVMTKVPTLLGESYYSVSYSCSIIIMLFLFWVDCEVKVYTAIRRQVMREKMFTLCLNDIEQNSIFK